MGPAEDEGEQERDPLRAAREVNLETGVTMGLVGATKSIVIHRDEYTYTGWESTLTNVSIGDVGKNKSTLGLAGSRLGRNLKSYWGHMTFGKPI